MDFTRLARPYFIREARRTDTWATDGYDRQIAQLRGLLSAAASCETGRRHGFAEMSALTDPVSAFTSRIEPHGYEEIRGEVMRMVRGEKDVLWPGICRDFAQSSGTSGGRSKYIPITPRNLRKTHYRGASDCVAHYLRFNPGSRIFSGKAMVLGGSFANELNLPTPGVNVGDLSATLINKINPLANLFRIPDKKTALIPDWSIKLPALVAASRKENITNISGVPSWFLTVIKEVMKSCGASKISDVWPNLEVFFHGGISFEPYREEYTSITDPSKMHFVETYNASEGFFATQNDPEDHAMLLIIDNDIFYEFIPVDSPDSDPVTIRDLEKDRVYEMLISSSNGLWRYRTGDTVHVDSTAPVKIRIAGRTKCFINAFGEELMEENAERAMAAAAQATGTNVANYTAAPIYADKGHKGCHQWLIEWHGTPADPETFSRILDEELRKLNSDYDAKRKGTIFLDPPRIISVPTGTFDRWLHSVGNHKLGGQRKVPRLSNDRTIADAILEIIR